MPTRGGGKRLPSGRPPAVPVEKESRPAAVVVEDPGNDSENSSEGRRSQGNVDESDFEDILAAPVER